jgi:ankyrin repeat protein
VDLFEAIEAGDLENVRKLADRTNLTEVDDSGESALAVAAGGGRLEIVQALLGAGADVNFGGVTTPLDSAVCSGNVTIVKKLIDAGADVNARLEDNQTALMSAAAAGDLEIVKVLIQAGANVTDEDDEGQTALDCAKANHHKAVVAFLAGRA